MDYFQVQEFFQQANPGKQISYDFDDQCIRQIESIYTDGKMHIVNHVQYQKVKVSVEGMSPVYVPIAPHRMLVTAANLKNKVANDDVYFHPKEIENLKSLKDKDNAALEMHVQYLSDQSGKSKEEILSQVK